MRSRTGSRSLRASSGSRSASNSIEPLRSAKSTVTCLRSPSRAALEVRIFSARCFGVYDSGEASHNAAAGGVGTPASAAPQLSQNLLLASTFAPQLGQPAASVAPHSRQKRAPSRLSAWHRGHFIPEPPSSWAREGRNGEGRLDRSLLRGQPALHRP